MSEILIYQSEDGQTKIQTTLEDETVWLTQAQLCDLFQKSKSTISEHIKHIFEEGELEEGSVVRDFRTTANDGKNYTTKHYNLDVIISVGYRVKSLQGTKFRQWATSRLKEYIVKGFTMNDELLKEAGGGNYFDELLERIRDIRSSEKLFYRKVLDIYATSIDYDPKSSTSIEFFQTIQNKMHFAAHGKTAAEIIFDRVDSTQDNIGLTSFKGDKPTKAEVGVAKNYLTADELDTLNRIVTMYLEFAELQAKMKKAMYMKDWIKKLDDFLSISDFEVLKTKGIISHKQALDKANAEYLVYKEKIKSLPTKAETDFIEFIEESAKKLKK